MSEQPVNTKMNIVKIAGIIIGALALIAAGVFMGLSWARTPVAQASDALDNMPFYRSHMMSFDDGDTPDDGDDYPGWGGHGHGWMWDENYEGSYGPGMMGGGYGPGMMSGSYGPMAEYHEIMEQALADALGLTLEELQAEFDAGKTLWEIADEQGVDFETLQEAMVTARAEMVSQALADGVITDEQAEWMLSHEPGDCPMWDEDGSGADYSGRGPGGGRGRGRGW